MTLVESDLDTRVRAVKDRIAAAQRARARADHERDTATAAATAAGDALRTEFGVETVADARAALADLDEQLATQLTALEQALDELEDTT